MINYLHGVLSRISRPMFSNCSSGRLSAVSACWFCSLYSHDVILTSDMLLELPSKLRSELHKAALVQDRQALTELIERIKSLAPETAEGLRVLVEGFQLGRIREILARDSHKFRRRQI